MKRAANPLSLSGLCKGIPRGFDAKPIWAQINVTWRCNLSCGYCTEYDNSKGHVPAPEIMARIDRCKQLGVLHADLIGGEPLLHPDIFPLMRHVVQSGMSTGMTTNGFLLTEEKLDTLLDLGMGRIQISVDRLNPSRETPKSLHTLRSKIEMVARRGLWFYVAAVLCPETLDEVVPLAEHCFDLGVPVFFSVVHERGRLKPGPLDARYLEKLHWLRQKKREGNPVSNPYYLIRYFERALAGRPMRWACRGSNKAFYVSPEGNIQNSYHVDPLRPFAEVTSQDIRRLQGAKGCEDGCGVDCMIRTSLPFSNRTWVVGHELAERVRGLWSRLGPAPARSPGSASKPSDLDSGNCAAKP
jgi:MoaA/NifB/PqqE/SkfB family radical SAM enzyme